MSAAPLATATTQPLALWRNRTFLSLWIGQTMSIIGDGFHSVALGLWVLQTTGSAMAMASIMIVRVLTSIALGAVAGTVVDRVDRRRLMITMNLARFVLVMGVAWLVATPGTPFAAVVALSGVISLCGLFFGPALQASLANIVGKENLPRATSTLQMTNTIAQIIGPSLGGAVVAMSNGWTALTMDALSFLFSAGMIFWAGSFPSIRREGQSKGSFWKDMSEGFAYIRQQPFVRSIVVIGPALNFFGNALGVIFPVVAVKVWMASPAQFGVLEAAFPLGFAIGAGAIMALGSKVRRRGWWILGSQVVTGLLAMLVFLMPSINYALPIIPFIGIMLAICNVMLMVAVQAEVPTEVQGRVFGTLNSFMNVASPLAMFVAGTLADMFAPNTIAVGVSVGMTLVAVLAAVFASAVRRYE